MKRGVEVCSLIWFKSFTDQFFKENDNFLYVFLIVKIDVDEINAVYWKDFDVVYFLLIFFILTILIFSWFCLTSFLDFCNRSQSLTLWSSSYRKHFFFDQSTWDSSLILRFRSWFEERRWSIQCMKRYCSRLWPYSFFSLLSFAYIIVSLALNWASFFYNFWINFLIFKSFWTLMTFLMILYLENKNCKKV